MLQDGQIPVGLHGKTQSVRQRAKPFVQFLVGAINCSAAIHIGWRAKLLRNRIQRHSLTNYFFPARAPLSAFHRREMRRESSRIHEFNFARSRITRMAHHPFPTTTVHPSETASLSSNHSPS